jgi:hypothetical protein
MLCLKEPAVYDPSVFCWESQCYPTVQYSTFPDIGEVLFVIYGWKVIALLVIPKDMSKDSKRPYQVCILVLNVFSG